MKFLHVGINFGERRTGLDQLQAQFGRVSWARYAPNCWIVRTDETPQELATKLRTTMNTDDSIFVCEIDMRSKFGWLPKNVWDWINQFDDDDDAVDDD